MRVYACREFAMSELQDKAIALHHEQRARHTVPSYGQALALANLMEQMHMEVRPRPRGAPKGRTHASPAHGCNGREVPCRELWQAQASLWPHAEIAVNNQKGTGTSQAFTCSWQRATCEGVRQHAGFPAVRGVRMRAPSPSVHGTLRARAWLGCAV